jgi:siroheme synthase
VRQALLERGYRPGTPVALCESASLPQARSLHGTLAELADLAAHLGDGPALILVGEVLARSAQQVAPAASDSDAAAAESMRRARAIARPAR